MPSLQKGKYHQLVKFKGMFGKCGNSNSECVWFFFFVAAELFADVQDTSAMAYSVSNSDGVCFVPSFSGLQVWCGCQCV